MARACGPPTHESERRTNQNEQAKTEIKFESKTKRQRIPKFKSTQTGTRFFPGYVSERRRAAVDAAALAWQDDGRRRMRVLARAGLAQDQAALLPERATVDAITSAAQPSRSNGWGLGRPRQQAQQAQGQQQQAGGGGDAVEVPVPKTGERDGGERERGGGVCKGG